MDELLAAYSYLILSGGNLKSEMPLLERVRYSMFYVMELKWLFLNYGKKVKLLKNLKSSRKEVGDQMNLGNAVLKKTKHDFSCSLNQFVFFFNITGDHDLRGWCIMQCFPKRLFHEIYSVK